MLAKELLCGWSAERWSERRLVLGVSGGADSVALLLAMHELSGAGQLVVAHLNHGWRGQESDEDAAFVVKLCADLGRPCVTALLRNRDSGLLRQSDGAGCRETAMLANKFDLTGLPVMSDLAEPMRKENALQEDALAENGLIESALVKGLRTEEKARHARYEFFKETAYECGASYVVTAHTADDRVETLLHNMLRGAGLAGAASLVMFRALDEDLVLARPLLRKRRSEIEVFLAARGQNFRQDSSNLLNCYRRNFLRRDVLPSIAQQYTQASASLLNFSELAEELLADLELLADRWLADVGFKTVTAPDQPTFSAPHGAFRSMPWSIVQVALRRVWLECGWPQADMSRAHWQSLRELSIRSVGVLNLPGNLRAESHGGSLTISLNHNAQPSSPIVRGASGLTNSPAAEG